MQWLKGIASLAIVISLAACGGGGGGASSGGSNGSTGGTGGSGGTGTNGPVPAIASIYPASITAGAYDSAVYVDGSNFTATSVVNNNGSARPTQYISSSRLQVRLPAADIAPGSSVSLTVTNSSGTSNPVALGLSAANYSVRRISMGTGTDPTWDEVHQVIYIFQGGQLTVVDPVSGTTRDAPLSGLTLGHLRISDDDQFLYVYQLTAIGSLQRLHLPDLSVDAAIPLLAGPVDVQVAPGLPRTIAVSGSGVIIYDDKTPRATRVPATSPPTQIVWGSDASALYGRGPSGMDTFFQMAVDASGVTITGTQSNPVINGLGTTPPTGIMFDGSQRRVYLETGDNWSQALDPQAVQWAGRFDAPGLPVADSTTGKAFQVFYTQPGNATIASFDLKTRALIGAISYPEPGPGGTPAQGGTVRAIRWGSDGLAYVTGSGMTLVNGAFVSAPPKSTAPIPVNRSTVSGQRLLVVPLAVNDLVWNPHDQRLYLAVSGIDTSYGNSIVSIDPQTGSVIATRSVVSDPTRIVVSDDGQFLYVGLLGAGAIERIKLPEMTVDAQMPLGWNASPLNLFPTARVVLDLAVAPGLPHTLAAATGTINELVPAQNGSLMIFDDTIPRANSASSIAQDYDSVQWGSDASALYAADGETSLDALFSFAVDPTGLSNPAEYFQAFAGSFRRIYYDSTTKLVYGGDGHAVNPVTGTRVGDFQGASWVAVDAALGKAWTIPPQPFKQTVADVTIQSFNLATYAPISSVVVPNVQGRLLQFTRWGSNGLAFCSDLSGVYILSGSLVN